MLTVANRCDHPIRTRIALALVLGVAGVVPLSLSVPSAARGQTPKIEFWGHQHRGANCFNQNVTPDWWAAAREAGIQVVRLAPNKWVSHERDFLIGNADRFVHLVPADLAALLAALADADAHDVKVVVTTLSLPGARWRQQNGDQSDLRLWRDTTFWDQAAQFWRELALNLKSQPAVVGYNILNEPTPELAVVPDGATLLDRFHRFIIAAIRTVDSETPIILDGGHWASPQGLAELAPVPDTTILYSFHVYEPYEYINRKINGGRFCYPGPVVQEAQDTLMLDTNALAGILEPVVAWQQRYSVPTRRVFVGEFGCHRTTCGAADYMSDLIRLFNRHNWHWAFYAFREDTWDGMDYELGTKPPGWAYWQAIDRGEKPTLPRVKNPVWDGIRRSLRASNK